MILLMLKTVLFKRNVDVSNTELNSNKTAAATGTTTTTTSLGPRSVCFIRHTEVTPQK